MALVKCPECGHDVSTTAAACPHCGAPVVRIAPLKQTPPGAWKWVAGLVVGAVAILGAASIFDRGQPQQAAPAASSATQAPAAASIPEVPTAPREIPHAWSIRARGEYGYEQALSDEDKTKGIASKPYLMVRLLEFNDDRIRFAEVKGPVRQIVSCTLPCESVTIVGYVGGEEIERETMPVADNSILAAVIEDISNGQLEVYRGGK